jgi:hypothetical protein
MRLARQRPLSAAWITCLLTAGCVQTASAENAGADPLAATPESPNVGGSTGARDRLADDARKLASMARDAKSKLRLRSPADVERARGQLRTALGALDAYLQTGGATGAAWRRFLSLDLLLRAARPRAKTPARQLEAVYRRFRSDQQGLELPLFRQVRIALRSFIDAEEQLRHPAAIDDLDAHLERLATSLETFADRRSSEEQRAIGQVLDWLDRHGQAAELAGEVRQRLSQPNLYLHLSDKLVAAGSDRTIDDDEAIQDVILGTSINGRGHTIGHVRTRLVPNEQQAMFETRLEAVNEARTVGANGPARIGSATRTSLAGRKRFSLDATGYHVWPATGTAATRSQTYGIWSNKHGCVDRLVRRVASKRVGEQKQTAENIGARHAQDRLARRLDAEAGEQLARANADFLDKFRRPLIRLGYLPRELSFHTTADELRMVALQDGMTHLAAPEAPPELPAGAALVVRLHESLVNNLAQDVLADRTVDQARLEQVAVRLFGRLPENLQADEERGPWSITFARREPVSLHIEGHQATLVLRGRRFMSGDRGVETPMNVTIRYQLQREAGRVRAVREGEIEVFPPDFVPNSGRRLNARTTGIRNMLRRRFEKIFAEELASEGLILPGAWSRAGRLDLVELEADRGWLALGWRQASEARSVVE